MVAFFASANTTAPRALKLTMADGAKLPHVGRGWYTLELSNRQIEAFLSRSSVCQGAFVVRPCARRRLQYCLSIKVAGSGIRPPSFSTGGLVRQPTLYQELETYCQVDTSPLSAAEEDAVRHYMIAAHQRGVQLRHSQLVFPDLVALVRYYEQQTHGDLPCRLTNLTGSGSCQEVDGQQLYVPTLPLSFTLKTTARRNDGLYVDPSPHPIDDRVQPPTSSHSFTSAPSSMGSQHSLTREAFLNVPEPIVPPGRLTPSSLDSADSLSSRPLSSPRQRTPPSRQSSADTQPPWLSSPSSSTPGSFKRTGVRASRSRAGSESFTHTPDKAGHARRTRSTDVTGIEGKCLDYSPHTLGTTISIAQHGQEGLRVKHPQTVLHLPHWDQRDAPADKALVGPCKRT
jgi:hypothetical protein